MMRLKLLFGLILLSYAVLAQKEITFNDILLNDTFKQESVYNVNWMNDGRFYTTLEGNMISKYDVTTGQQIEILVNGDDLDLKIDEYKFNSDERKLLLMTERASIYRRSYEAVFYIYDLETGILKKLSENGKQSYATFSPDSKMVAFTRDNNLFYVVLEDMKEVRVTTDGQLNKIINGSSDWVYEEEFSITKAFFWSPNSKKIAFLKFDESGVKEYTMQRWNNGDLYPENYKFKYPKAGEANSKVNVYVFNINTEKKTEIDIGDDEDVYIPRMLWTKNPELLSVLKLNRLQNRLDIIHANTSNGESEIIFTERSNTYIDLNYCDDLMYLDDGAYFIFSSEREGNKHFYLHRINGQLVQKITQGDYEAVSLVRVDQNSRRPALYYISTEASPQERHFYKVELTGKRKRKLSLDSGVNSVDMSPDAKYYLIYNSNHEQPLKVSLFETRKNNLVKVLKDNEQLAENSKAYNLQSKEFFRYKTLDDTFLNGYMIKPADFDSTKSYPVLIYQYSGPGSQNVKKSWGGSFYYWHQMLVQNGYIVAVIDTRGTGGRGADFKKMTYKNLGKLEVEDHIEGAKYLSSLPFVEGERIGIWGWSYGGYISSLALFRGADYFKTAIAVAPVTNWRFYDTIYTERYLQRPQDNPSGYNANSPITHANKLEGNFLLVHGTGDDNVHFQNTVALQNELIKSGSQFETFIYPDKAHGIRGAHTRKHLYKMMTNFLLENL